MPHRLIHFGLKVVAPVAAAFALCVSGQAQAQSAAAEWTPTVDDSLLVELRAGRYTVGDMIRGYQTLDGVCIDLGDTVAALDIALRVDPKSRRATGWVFSEDNPLTIDRDSDTVQNVNGRRKLRSGELYDTPEGWCVSTTALSAWFGATFRFDMQSLSVVIESEGKLPFLEQLERKSRAARLRPKTKFDITQLPQADLPYRDWRTPAVDVLARASLNQSAGGTARTEFRYEAYASGEVLGASVNMRLASDNQGLPESLRLRAYKIDPEGGLLGPLRATQVAVGDVQTNAGQLTAQSAVGRGAFISNRPLERPSQFGSTNLRGALPAGWDAELYRNGQLIAYQTSRADGRYEFLEIALLFGQNLLDVVLYGPQGQVRRESTSIPVGQQSIPSGKTYYWAGVVEQNRDLIDLGRDPAGVGLAGGGWRWGVGVERGIDQRTMAGLGAYSVEMLGQRYDYVEANLQRTIGPALVSLTGAQQLGAGRAYKLDAIGQIGTLNFQAESLWIDGVYESELVDSETRQDHRLTLDYLLPIGRSTLPLQAGYRHVVRRDGTRVNEWLTRFSLLMRGVSLTAGLSHQEASGQGADRFRDGTQLNLLGNTVIAGVRVRGKADFRIGGQRAGFEKAEISAEARLTDRSDLRLSVAHDAGGRTSFSAGYVHQFEQFALRGDARLGSDGSFGFGASLAFSLGRDPVDGGLRITNEKLAQKGSAAVTVFLDENGDGRRQAGEEPVEGVTIEAGMLHSKDPTDGSGRTVLDGLSPYKPVMLAIDLSTLPDPLMQPKLPGIVVTPRPGVEARIELALSPTGEVEGTLLGPGGGTRGGVTLELVDAGGRVVKETMTEFDGFFLFDQVPYGRYTLQVAQSAADALGGQSDLGIAVELAKGRDLEALGFVRVESDGSDVAPTETIVP